jgi:hypothetical protein
MDIKRIIYDISHRLGGLSLALPTFVVGLGFMILGVTLFPGIGILVGIFIWWIAWRFMLSSSRKSQIKEALKRIREKQTTSAPPQTSEYEPPATRLDESGESITKSTKE